MTQLVTVQTDFTDLEQMAEGLVGRVHDTHVILPAGASVDEGEWATFDITLYDGSSGLAGVGRCVTVVDNGEDREPHQRFDVVLDSLQFDTHEQSVFEHILALHGAGGQQLEEVSADEAESLRPEATHEDATTVGNLPEDTGSFVDVDAEFSGSAPVSVPAPDYDDDAAGDDAIPEDRTMVATADEIESAYVDSIPSPGGEENDVMPHAPAAPALPVQRSHGGGGGGGASYGHGGAAVAHAVHNALIEESFEEPLSGERIAPIAQPRPLHSNSFAYADGIPFPAKPPRPELEPSLRVTPAPRPAGSSHH